jgi:hypothetical protein
MPSVENVVRVEGCFGRERLSPLICMYVHSACSALDIGLDLLCTIWGCVKCKGKARREEGKGKRLKDKCSSR